MEMTVANLQRHADQLSKAFDVVIVYDKTLKYEEAGALRFNSNIITDWLQMPTKGVIARPIVDEATYAVVMHEMGHHLAPNGYCNYPQPKPGCHPRDWFNYRAAQLVAEEAAWDWARYYIEQQFVWTVAMEQVKQYAFGTYQTARRLGR